MTTTSWCSRNAPPATGATSRTGRPRCSCASCASSGGRGCRGPASAPAPRPTPPRPRRPASALSTGAARRAFATQAELPAAARPERAVLFYNPKSGGGKAERFHVADEARARGVEPIELARGDDLRVLVLRAIEGGADALAMAGGDGSQAIVAAAAAEYGLPYACIPAGTRNHFALDLGVDRDDVVGALEAFVDGRERVVDLAEVNGRVFVNNVSLGLYAEAVQQDGYRDAKIRTILATIPNVLGPNGEPL